MSITETQKNFFHQSYGHVMFYWHNSSAIKQENTVSKSCAQAHGFSQEFKMTYLIEGDMKVVEYLSEFLFSVYATFED